MTGLAAVIATYSVADEVDLLAGVLAPWGERPPRDAATLTFPSALGLSPVTVFLETRVYF